MIFFNLLFLFINLINLINLNHTYAYLNINYDIDDNFLFDYNNIYSLSLFAKNVYTSEPENLFGGIHQDISIGDDNLRVYVYSNIDNSSYVIAIKGTSTILSLTSEINNVEHQDINLSSSVYNDRFNDNLYFSCCFYKESNMYNSTSCSNESSLLFQKQNNKYNKLNRSYYLDKKCNKSCYEHSLTYENNYLNIATKIMEKFLKFIKKDTKTQIVITGHSLGGAIATMLGLIYDKPVVTFETPGEKHYIELINLNNQLISNKNIDNIHHVGHNADPIYTGKCNGFTSICNIGGYKIDTKCHIGKTYEYDSIGKLGISESIFTHKITYVIDNIITKFNSSLPELKRELCEDCESWIFN